MNKDKKSFSKRIANRFFTGLFAILPMGVTIWLVYKIVVLGDAFFAKILAQYFEKTIPGFGFILTIIFIFIIGVIVNSFLGKKLKELIENIFLRVPIVKSIYSPIKDFVENFTKKDSSNFKKVVFVNFPNDNLSKSIGFITKEHIMVNGEEKTAVFIPTTPNPTNGFLIYLNKEDYEELDLPVDEALKTIVSLGTVSPVNIKVK